MIKFHVVTTTELDIYSRICVRRPYFAFADLTSPETGVAEATIPVEAPKPANEPISLAEITRHGAILGLCAVSTHATDNAHRYYLATAGHVAWSAPPERRAQITAPLLGHSIGKLDTSKRRGSAKTFLTTQDGEPIARMGATYAIFSDAAFGRMFSHVHRPDLDPADTVPGPSPYTRPLPLDDYEPHGDASATAVIAAQPEQCLGHFDHYPALPVAVIVRAAFDLTERLANTTTPGRWSLQDGQMHPIRQLIPAGRPVTLAAEIVHTTPTSRLVRIDLSSEGGEFGHLTIHLTRTA